MIKKNKIKITVFLIYAFLYYMLFMQFITGIKHSSKNGLLLFIAISILAILSTIFIIKEVKKNFFKKPERVFLIATILYGLIYMIFIPAINGTDELPHFLRPYQISTGDVFIKDPQKTQTKMPDQLLNLVYTNFRDKYSKENIFTKTDYTKNSVIWYGDITSSRYSPLPYIPQIIGFLISRLLKLSPVLTFYCVRLMNFSSWVIIMYFAFKFLPNKKITNMILLLSPAVLSLVSTSSGDTFATALILLFTSLLLKFKSEKKIINKRDKILIFLTCILFSTFKVFYVIITLLLFILPNESFKNKKEKYIFILSSIFCSFFIDVLWYMLSCQNIMSGESLVSKQISFILHNPINYVFAFFNTFIDNVYYYITNLFAGNEMCYGSVRVNNLFVIMYVIIFALSLFNEKSKKIMNNKNSFLIFIICAILFGLVSTTLYLDHTAVFEGVGSNYITGIQARYFLCEIPLLISIVNTKRSLKINDNKILISCFIVNSLLIIDTFKSLLINVI